MDGEEAAREDVKLTLTGKLSYSGEITLAQAVQVLGLLTSQSAGPNSGGTANGIAGAEIPMPRQVAMSPKQALEAAGAKTNPEKIVAFAALVSRQSGSDAFTLDDVKPLFKQARETAPGNMARDLSTAIQNGWVAEADKSGEYYLLGAVADVLEHGFDGSRSGKQAASKSRSTGTRSSSPRRARKPASLPPVFADAEVSPVIDGLIDFHKLKTKTEKYLWAVYAAKLLGVEAVEPAEMVWLTDRLGEMLPSANLNSYFRGNQRSGYVNKNAQGKVRILPSGVKYLQDIKAEKVN